MPLWREICLPILRACLGILAPSGALAHCKVLWAIRKYRFDYNKRKVKYLVVPFLGAAFSISLVSCSGVRDAAENSSVGASRSDTLVVMSYNIENFFDPEDNPEKNDDDFTPDGQYHWTVSRMKSKAARLARAIVSANGWHVPDIVGLCEVEGPDSSGVSAADYLVRYGGLDSDILNYKAVCFPTPDKRGVATAMLYNSTTMRPLDLRPVNVSCDSLDLCTRDVLYAKMQTYTGGAVFHLMVNHWPSKFGGVAATIPKRRYVAERVRALCDSILGVEPDARIVLMGDFNDEASEPSLSEYLGAKTKCDTCRLRNLSADTKDYSYKYHGRWNTIDHIIVSPGACAKGRPSFSVVKFDFLLEPDDRNPGTWGKPKRTYIGRRFNAGPDGLGGYSDHLPVMTKIAY